MNDKKIKILFYGDAACSTGFGTVSKNILVPLHETGRFDINVLGINYWGNPHDFPFAIWPVGNNAQRDPYGRKMVQERILAADFDILFMIQDSFILDFIKDLIPKLKEKRKDFRSIVYFPIDGVPKPSWIEAMSYADYPVTYTEYGFNQCAQQYPPIKDNLRIIPHGSNIDDFYPLPYSDVLEFRHKYFGPLASKFIVTNLNRNQQRKNIPHTMMAFKEFNSKYPDTLLYLHMSPSDVGWDLLEVCRSLGLVLNRDVVFPYNFSVNQGYPVEILNLIYNASDVVMSTHLGEGWGLSCTEAMATSTAVVFPDNTASTEIVGKDRGLLVKSGADLEHWTIITNDNEVKRPLTDIGDMVDKLEMVYRDEALRMELGENGYRWVRDTLVWDKHIVPQWLNIINMAVDDLNNVEEDDACFYAAEEI